MKGNYIGSWLVLGIFSLAPAFAAHAENSRLPQGCLEAEFISDATEGDEFWPGLQFAYSNSIACDGVNFGDASVAMLDSAYRLTSYSDTRINGGLVRGKPQKFFKFARHFYRGSYRDVTELGILFPAEDFNVGEHASDPLERCEHELVCVSASCAEDPDSQGCEERDISDIKAKKSADILALQAQLRSGFRKLRFFYRGQQLHLRRLTRLAKRFDEQVPKALAALAAFPDNVGVSTARAASRTCGPEGGAWYGGGNYPIDAIYTGEAC